MYVYSYNYSYIVVYLIFKLSLFRLNSKKRTMIFTKSAFLCSLPEWMLPVDSLGSIWLLPQMSQCQLPPYISGLFKIIIEVSYSWLWLHTYMCKLPRSSACLTLSIYFNHGCLFAFLWPYIIFIMYFHIKSLGFCFLGSSQVLLNPTSANRFTWCITAACSLSLLSYRALGLAFSVPFEVVIFVKMYLDFPDVLHLIPL